MTTEQINKRIVLRFNNEVLGQGSIEALKELVAEDFINQTAAGGVSKDITGLIEFIQWLHTGFSALRIEIHAQVCENDIVATRKTIHAVHTGVILGHEPTGRPVAFKVMDFVRLEYGQYKEHWGQNNVMDVIAGLS